VPRIERCAPITSQIEIDDRAKTSGFTQRVPNNQGFAHRPLAKLRQTHLQRRHLKTRCIIRQRFQIDMTALIHIAKLNASQKRNKPRLATKRGSSLLEGFAIRQLSKGRL